jgi:hypothetical protein
MNDYKIVKELILHDDSEIVDLYRLKKPVNIPLIYYCVYFTHNVTNMKAEKWINKASVLNYYQLIELEKDSLIRMEIARVK